MSSGASPSSWWAYGLVHVVFGSDPVNDSALTSDSLDDSQEVFGLPRATSSSESSTSDRILIINEDSIFECGEEIVAGPSNINTTQTVHIEILEPGEPLLNSTLAISNGDDHATTEGDDTENLPPAIGPPSKRRKLEEVFSNDDDLDPAIVLMFLQILKMIRLRDSQMSLRKSKKSFNNMKIVKLLGLINQQYKFHGERTIWSKPKALGWYNNIYPTLNDREFKEHFRVSRCTLRYLIFHLTPRLEKQTTNMREAISVEKRIAISLHYMSSSEEYRVVGSLFGVGKSTANSIVHDFVQAINSVFMKKFIKLPSNIAELKIARNDFEALLGFPQCISAVDGCHIPVNPPKEYAVSYHNYKGFNSMVLLASVDARYRFTYVTVGSPGRNNDSYVFNNSYLGRLGESDFFDQVVKEINGVSVPICMMGDCFPIKKAFIKALPRAFGTNC